MWFPWKFRGRSIKMERLILTESPVTQMWDWRLFLLLLGADWISAAQAKIGRNVAAHNDPVLPSWLSQSAGSIFLVITMPLSWANVIVPIVMLFRHPWWVVLSLGIAAFVIAGVLDRFVIHFDQETFIKWIFAMVFLAGIIVVYTV
jgi:hypothetical protein